MSDVREDGTEILHYDEPEFPLFCRHNYIPAGFPLRKYTPNHFHDEVEMIYIEKGLIHHTVNGEYLTLKEGEGLFINSNQFHELITDNKCDCTLYCLIFNPKILSNCAQMDKIVNSISNNENLEYILLNAKTPWQKDVIDSLIKIVEFSSDENQSVDICAAMGEVFRLWGYLYENVDKEENSEAFVNTDLRLVKDMMLFIQSNYGSDISLEQICKEFSIGKTKCTALFNQYVSMAPIEYLRSFRIEKSIEFLKKTNMSMSEIAYEVGFSGASYYGEYFKKMIGITPLQYRKQHILFSKEGEE